ncbi:hypothetical protein AALB64_11330 [Lachnospiraceae bacterium 45-P1]
MTGMNFQTRSNASSRQKKEPHFCDSFQRRQPDLNW